MLKSKGVGPPQATRSASLHIGINFTSLCNFVGALNTIHPKDIPLVGVLMMTVGSSF